MYALIAPFGDENLLTFSLGRKACSIVSLYQSEKSNFYYQFLLQYIFLSLLSQNLQKSEACNDTIIIDVHSHPNSHHQMEKRRYLCICCPLLHVLISESFSLMKFFYFDS